MDAGDVLQALWDAAGAPAGPPIGEGWAGRDGGLVKATFFVHVAERVVCEPCGNKVTHTARLLRSGHLRLGHQHPPLPAGLRSHPHAIWRFTMCTHAG